MVAVRQGCSDISQSVPQVLKTAVEPSSWLLWPFSIDQKELYTGSFQAHRWFCILSSGLRPCPSFVAVSTSPSMRRSRPKNIKGPSMISFDSHTTILGQTKRWTHELPAIKVSGFMSLTSLFCGAKRQTNISWQPELCEMCILIVWSWTQKRGKHKNCYCFGPHFRKNAQKKWRMIKNLKFGAKTWKSRKPFSRVLGFLILKSVIDLLGRLVAMSTWSPLRTWY